MNSPRKTAGGKRTVVAMLLKASARFAGRHSGICHESCHFKSRYHIGEVRRRSSRNIINRQPRKLTDVCRAQLCNPEQSHSTKMLNLRQSKPSLDERRGKLSPARQPSWASFRKCGFSGPGPVVAPCCESRLSRPIELGKMYS